MDCEYSTIPSFIRASDPATCDKLLSDVSVSSAGVVNNNGVSALHWIAINRECRANCIQTESLLSYLLTCTPTPDINGKTANHGLTPIASAVNNNNTTVLRRLIDFNGDRNIEHLFSRISKPSNCEAIEMLSNYFPSEE